MNSKFKEALVLYNEAISENPKLLDAHTGLILTCFRLEQGDSIVAIYDSLYRKWMDDPVYLYAYGYALLTNGNPDSAMCLYQRALDLGLDEGRVYKSIGYIYELRGKNDSAEIWYRKAMDKKFGYAYFSLSNFKKGEEKEKLMLQGLKYLQNLIRAGHIHK